MEVLVCVCVSMSLYQLRDKVSKFKSYQYSFIEYSLSIILLNVADVGEKKKIRQML